ncbi:carbohydrate ABC transporter permease [Catenulispora subtropica]|uniref:carbohydrate ABC transporter permease n=1 Tax=Catenulispora subtropica TaxID=450798 RepID=UPI003CD0A71A
MSAGKVAGRPEGGARPGPAAAGGRPGKPAFTLRRGLAIAGYLAPAALFVGVFVYYPMVSGSQMAFRHWDLNDLTDTSFTGWGNFKAVFDDPVWGTVLVNTLVWVVGSLVPQLVIGFALALWLRRRFRFRGLYQALVFFPWAVSGFLIGILFRWLFNGEFGVVNDLLQKTGISDQPIAWLADPGKAMVAVTVANVWYGVTFFAIMIMAALQSVPEELYEASALDGAGKVRTLFQVTVPYIRTTLALTVLLRVIWIFNFPDLIFGMTGGGPSDQTQIVTSWMITTTQQGDYGKASALGLMVVATLLAFSVCYLSLSRRKGESL